MDVTFDDVQDSAEIETERAGREGPEERALRLILAAAVFFVIALAARMLLVPQAPEHLVEPAFVVELPQEQAAPVLELRMPPLEIPTGK